MPENNSHSRQQRFNCRAGNMMVFIAFVMIVFLAGAAFSVDIAYMHLVKAELRTAVDAASRAGTETLIRTQDADSAIASAQVISERNRVGGNGLTLNLEDIEIGSSSQQSDGGFDFRLGGNRLNAVRVIGRRDANSPDGEVNLFFGGVFGVETFSPVLDATSASSVRDVALVLDRSGSMGRTLSEGGQTRLQALQAAVDVFISEIEDTSPTTRISLTTYANGASRDIPVTSDFNAIRSEVNAIQPNGKTNIFAALGDGSDSLEQDPNRRVFSDKTIVLLTDGRFNEGGTPIPSAILAASRNHVIHTITFSSEANQDIMKQVAGLGNGMHIHADDGGDLSAAFRDIAKSLSVLLVD